MKIAVNAWFLDTDLEHTTGSGQYARCVLDEISRLAPDVRLEMVKPRRRDDWSKLYFEQVQFPREAARMKADIAFVPYWAPPLASRVPVVVTIHDVSYEAHPEWFRWSNRLSFRLFSRWAAKTARRIITVSEYSKTEIMKHYRTPENKIRVISEAVGEGFQRILDKNCLDQTKQKYNINRPFILFVGQIHTRRNIERLLQVFYDLKTKKKIDHQLILVGQNIWPFLDLDSRIKENGLEGEVIYLDYIPRPDLVGLYNLASVFVYPSLYEGFGLPPLEAMACGTPVVSSNVASIPEVVGNAGLLVDPYNAGELSEAIWSIINNPALRSDLIQKGFERVKQFSWEKAARETLRVYEEAI